MREHRLEWLHRLASEPRRCWKCNLVTNTLFVLMAAWQLMGYWFAKRRTR
jgi:N-acetylglucosaminyldiphosphoundecaprenol N-acetyl-beta-D-mannosaminyltransferase